MNEETRRKQYDAAVRRLEALLARAKEFEVKEESKRIRARRRDGSAPSGKVIPFRMRPNPELPDPAA
jgi:hypothetical protein